MLAWGVRTTLNIESAILGELRQTLKREGGTLSALVSRLLTEALAQRARRPSARPFRWVAKPLQARVDLDDQEAVGGAHQG